MKKQGGGSKESGSNCERNRTTGQPKKKKSGTVRQTKPAKSKQKTPEKEKEKKEIPVGKGSVRKRIKSSSTTTSTDNNKSTDKNNSKGSSPDRELLDEQTSANKRTGSLSKEDTSNLKTSQEVKSKPIRKKKASDEKEEVKKEEISVGGGGSEKEGKKFNMHLAQLFFKRMMEAQKTSRSKNKDKNLEVMPDTSYMASKKKGIKKQRSSTNKTKKKRPVDPKVFKENGEPVWVIPELPEAVKLENGIFTTVPHLYEALDEEQIIMEDGKRWSGMIEEFSSNRLDAGIIKESTNELNPFDTFDNLEERSDVFFRMDSVNYYTMSNMINLSQDAIKRFEEMEEKKANCRKFSMEQKPSKVEEKVEEKEKTCIETSIVFNMDSTFSISYDRRRPILSIRKFRKKYQSRLPQWSMEKEKKAGSREGSREVTSRENA